MDASIKAVFRHISRFKRVGSAMGFPIFWLILVGAIVGQVVTLTHLGIWWIWYRSQEDLFTDLLAKGIQLAVKECSIPHHDLPSGAPELTLPATPFWFGSGPGELGLVGVIGFTLGFLTVGIPLFCCKLIQCRPRGSPNSELSPPSSPIEIGQIARHQLAELRLRRYGSD